jgi:hypothetical protein
VLGDRDPLYPVSLAVVLREAIPRSWLRVVPNGGSSLDTPVGWRIIDLFHSPEFGLPPSGGRHA